jgi:hypothetical protein
VSTKGKTSEERTIALVNAVEAEMLTTTDADVLEGLDVDALKKRGQARLAAAVAEAGRRRMAAARVAMKQAHAVRATYQFTPAEARQFLRSASNDERFTVAARGFEEMSDEDVMRLCKQLIELGAEPPKRDG